MGWDRRGQGTESLCARHDSLQLRRGSCWDSQLARLLFANWISSAVLCSKQSPPADFWRGPVSGYPGSTNITSIDTGFGDWISVTNVRREHCASLSSATRLPSAAVTSPTRKPLSSKLLRASRPVREERPKPSTSP